MRFTGTEIFAIPVGLDVKMQDNEAIWIIYSPLKDEIALVTDSDKEMLEQFYNNGIFPQVKELANLIADMDSQEIDSSVFADKDIRQFTKLSFLPNLICNFACSYCYSSAGRSSTVIPWEKVETALNYFIDETRIPQQHLSLFISGGGEPLLSWDIVKKSILYARQRAAEKGFTLQISIITNGALLTEEIARFAVENACSICVSFEVLQELQNQQRKHFDIVSKNIEMLGRVGVRTLINSTITPLSVGRMEDMVKSVVDKYPFIVQYTIEPVTGASVFKSRGELRQFYNDFYCGYIASKRIAEINGLNLRFTFDDALRGTVVRHCPGKFCLTPHGDISVCHLVSSPKETRYDNCVYGRVGDNGDVSIDVEKFNCLYGKNIFAYSRCQDCFAKWSCGGECMTRNDTYPEDYMEEVCCFNRKFIKHMLLERVSKTVNEEFGLSLEEYVR